MSKSDYKLTMEEWSEEIDKASTNGSFGDLINICIRLIRLLGAKGHFNPLDLSTDDN